MSDPDPAAQLNVTSQGENVVPTCRRSLLSAVLPMMLVPIFPGASVATPAGEREADMTDISSRNRAIVQDRFQAWIDGTGNPFELLEADATWTILGRSAAAKTYADKESFLREVIRPFNARMSAPLKPTVHSLLADGDQVVIFFDATAMARDGKPYVNSYFWIFEMKGGRVVKASALFDSIEFNDLWSRVQPA
jgi:uncharacterized protein